MLVTSFVASVGIALIYVIYAQGDKQAYFTDDTDLGADVVSSEAQVGAAPRAEETA